MKNFFCDLDDLSNIDKELYIRDCFFSDKAMSIKIMKQKIADLLVDPTNKPIHDIYSFVNLFSNPENDLLNFFFNELLEFYIEHVEQLVYKNKWHTLEVIMDLFNTNNVFRGNESKIERFVIGSLVLLQQNREDSISEKEIATDLFLELVLHSPEFAFSKYIVVDFLRKNKNNPYIDYIN